MIEISNVSIRNHECTALCTKHSAYKDRLDLNRVAKYKYHRGRPQYLIITGPMLTQGQERGLCGCVGLFDLRENTPLARRLAAAKSRTSRKNAPRKTPRIGTVMRRSLREWFPGG